MIKINLIKIGKDGKPISPVKVSDNLSLGGEAEVSDDGSQRDGLKRLLLIFLCPLALYVYFERIQNPDLVQQGDAMKVEMGKLETEIKKTSSILAAVKDFEKQTQTLKQRIEVIETLKRGRLLLVKVLDTIQTKIPQKTWLTKIDINNNALTITGMTKASKEVVFFEEQLRKSIFFKEVLTQKVSESKSTDGMADSFQIKAFIDEKLEDSGGSIEKR